MSRWRETTKTTTPRDVDREIRGVFLITPQRLIILIGLFFSLQVVAATTQDVEPCKTTPSWLKHTCNRLNQIWTQGSNELYLSGYAWHNRYTYNPNKIDSYNENAWGGGLGKGFYDEDGDWHGLSAIAFLDSHKNVEPVVGYTFLKILNLTEHARLGGGYSVFITARPDIFHGVPFPGALPWFSLIYRKVAITATYIPGAKGAGNVLFLLAKITL